LPLSEQKPSCQHQDWLFPDTKVSFFPGKIFYRLNYYQHKSVVLLLQKKPANWDLSSKRKLMQAELLSAQERRSFTTKKPANWDLSSKRKPMQAELLSAQERRSFTTNQLASRDLSSK
jgi:hypothetical protein